MTLPEFTADASLSARHVHRLGLSQDQFQKDAIIPQFLGLRGSMQFQRCQLICIPDPGGAGASCFYLCHPEAALMTHATEGLK
jgi:hypothetical protein